LKIGESILALFVKLHPAKATEIKIAIPIIDIVLFIISTSNGNHARFFLKHVNQ
jgi:hypothetical protein